jgi:predicted RNase H-like nuclease
MSVRIRELAPRSDARGSSFSLDEGYHLATIRPGHVRGNHFHREERELLVVLYTDAWTLAFDSGENTPIETRTYTGSGAVAIEIEPMSAHAIRNDGSVDLHLFVVGNAPAYPRRLLERPSRIAGVDGCPKGWIAVVKDGASLETGFCRADVDDDLVALMRECAVVAIDIPIGLPHDGPRLADHHARKFLGGTRASSVFSTPLRRLLGVADYAEANRLSRLFQKRGISKQSHAILPKIEQIDRILQRHHELRGRVYEVHPECTFSAWAEQPLPPKKTKEGADARRKLAASHFGAVPVTRGVHENDLLDALAALWTAERIYNGTHRELGDAHVDVTGLPMRIVY